MALFVAGCEKEKDPIQSDEVYINPEYVPIDWDSSTLLSSDDSAGTYRIQFEGQVPEVTPGSILAIDRDTVVRYIFVESVDVRGNTMEITSTEAYLTDIFYDSEFTLSTDNDAKSSGRGAVIHPVEAYSLGKDGSYSLLFKGGHRKSDTRITGNLWRVDWNNDGQPLMSGDHYAIYMDRMNFDLSIDMELYMNFGGRTAVAVAGSALERYRSKALEVKSALVGTFNTEQVIRCDIFGSCSYSPGYDIWKHNLFAPVYVKFVVSGVPVVITLRSDLYREVKLSASGQISAYTGFVDHGEGRLGFEWSQAGRIEPIHSFNQRFEVVPPTIEGRGEAAAKV
ncbi:MAG: hypothetical protein J6S87_03345, partial [Bacteroidales bacterium]|nr:hypothetical protein [Bacteroidales bacterium]